MRSQLEGLERFACGLDRSYYVVAIEISDFADLFVVLGIYAISASRSVDKDGISPTQDFEGLSRGS